MKFIKETLVDTKTALLADSKGFDEECLDKVYVGEDNKLYFLPIQSHLQKWLRDKHNLRIEILLGKDENTIWYYYNIYRIELVEDYNKDYDDIISSEHSFDIYEDALVDALKKCLSII
jgi:hypothetical protein